MRSIGQGEASQDAVEVGPVDDLAQQDGLGRSLGHVELLEVLTDVRGQSSLDPELVTGGCHGKPSPTCSREWVAGARDVTSGDHSVARRTVDGLMPQR